MTMFARLRRFLREFDTMLDHARTGRDPNPRNRPSALTARHVDGWYNSQTEITHGSHRH